MSVYSLHSSEQFATAMINGWLAVLMDFFPEMMYDEEVYLLKYGHRFGFKRNLGDIDLVLHFSTAQTWADILPTDGGYHIRPIEAKNIRVSGFLLECRRSCPSEHMKSKVDAFIKRCKGIHRNSNLRFMNRNGTDKIVHGDLARAIQFGNESYPFVFLFNGSDSGTVWNVMRERISHLCGPKNPTQINGRPVITIFCQSSSLIKWPQIRELETSNSELQTSNSELQTRIAELQNEIAELNSAS